MIKLFSLASIKFSSYQCGILSPSRKSVVTTKLGYRKKKEIVHPCQRNECFLSKTKELFQKN